MKLILKKFGAKWCQPCVELKKARTLEDFADAHPDVKVEVHDDSMKGSAKWDEIAEAHHVENIPVLIWCDPSGKELTRSTSVSANAIEKQYRKALEKL